MSKLHELMKEREGRETKPSVTMPAKVEFQQEMVSTLRGLSAQVNQISTRLNELTVATTFLKNQLSGNESNSRGPGRPSKSADVDKDTEKSTSTKKE